MIIHYPTALYEAILPTLTSVGNVTFTISSNDPPRGVTIVPPLQSSGSGKALPSRTINSETRRAALGGLFFVVASGTAYGVSDSKKAYEVGQLLDFSDASDNPPALNTALVPVTIELQQNTNVLDLTSIGLSTDEINSLTVNARSMLDISISQFNDAQTTIQQLGNLIQDNQRSLNELYKVEAAASIVLNDPVTMKKIEDKKQQLLAERTQLANSYNVETTNAQAIYTNILSIKEVVR